MTNEDVARSPSTHVFPIAALFSGVALVGGALVLDPAVAASGATNVSDLAPDFSVLDADADGTLSEKEWMDSAPASMMSDDMAAAHYSMYDADGDGDVSAEEYDQVNEEALGGMNDDPI